MPPLVLRRRATGIDPVTVQEYESAERSSPGVVAMPLPRTHPGIRNRCLRYDRIRKLLSAPGRLFALAINSQLRLLTPCRAYPFRTPHPRGPEGMPSQPQFEKLFAEYSTQESSPIGTDERSLRYFSADDAFDVDPASLAAARDRASVCGCAHSVKWRYSPRFMAVCRAPTIGVPSLRNYPKRPGSADWVRFQRKPATRDLHCDYQRRRLETLAGFSWDPLGEAWERQLGSLIQFMAVNRRMPKYRSAVTSERRLAGWLAKQRHLHRNGRLTQTRATALHRALMRHVV